MPWKNGGGTTTEIAVVPAGAGLDDFDWRIRMARVDGGGPFSLFPGIDRTLAILDGDGILLTVGNRVATGLTVASEPLPFPADEETHATLIGGPVTDLNVMTRRGRASHTVERITVTTPIEIETGTGTVIVFCAAGAIDVEAADDVRIGPRDTLLVGPETKTLRIDPAPHASILLIRIF